MTGKFAVDRIIAELGVSESVLAAMLEIKQGTLDALKIKSDYEASGKGLRLFTLRNVIEIVLTLGVKKDHLLAFLDEPMMKDWQCMGSSPSVLYYIVNEPDNVLLNPLIQYRALEFVQDENSCL